MHGARSAEAHGFMPLGYGHREQRMAAEDGFQTIEAFSSDFTR